MPANHITASYPVSRSNENSLEKNSQSGRDKYAENSISCLKPGAIDGNF